MTLPRLYGFLRSQHKRGSSWSAQTEIQKMQKIDFYPERLFDTPNADLDPADAEDLACLVLELMLDAGAAGLLRIATELSNELQQITLAAPISPEFCFEIAREAAHCWEQLDRYLPPIPCDHDGIAPPINTVLQVIQGDRLSSKHCCAHCLADRAMKGKILLHEFDSDNR